MSTYFTHPSHMPCPECGASVARDEADLHECDAERLIDYRMFQLREEVTAFDAALRAYLDSPQGRFDQWLAEREREPE